jgi:hypothetical protein
MAINFPDTPSANDVFVAGGSAWLWNGTTWTDNPVGLTLDSLGNVSVASAVAGEVVQYDGTGWVNADIVAQIIDSAPSTLNTLNALAAALGDDENFATTVTNSIATRVSQTDGTVTTATEASAVVRNITLSTTVPTVEGSDGDVWLVYTA